MGAYSKVVSVVRQIDTAHTFIGGTKADITSAWTFVNGERQQVFPSSEYYTQIYAKTDAGAYSETLPYGRYKIVISGAGGGGAAAEWNSAHGTRYAENGWAGEELTIFVDVGFGATKTVSGVLGNGGGAAAVNAKHTNYNYAGTGGTGYENGATGTITKKYTYGPQGQLSGYFFTAGGGGGGSSSLEIDGTLNSVARGGNGGTACHANAGAWGYGGAGGSGGTTGGTGATGGAAAAKYGDGQLYASAGTDGYIRIYLSSIYPN